MFLRYSIKISSWLLLTVASFNFIGTNFPTTCLFYYSIKDDLVEFHKPRRWVSTTCHFFPQFTKTDTHKNNWIHSNRIYYNKWCVITYFVCVYVRTEMCTNNKCVSTMIWKCLDRLYWFFFLDLWCFNATFNNISAISWGPVCMSDEYASDNVNRKRFWILW
jgi:hypothetical protein